MNIIEETMKNLIEGNENIELLKSIEPGTSVRIYNRRNKGGANFIPYTYQGMKANYYGQGEDEYIFRDEDGDYNFYRTSEIISMPKDSIKLPKNRVNPRPRYNDAIELVCSECGTITRFYYVNIKPYIDFYTEEYKYPDEIKCPVCGAPNDGKYDEPHLSLERFLHGTKSPDGRKFDIIKKRRNK